MNREENHFYQLNGTVHTNYLSEFCQVSLEFFLLENFLFELLFSVIVKQDISDELLLEKQAITAKAMRDIENWPLHGTALKKVEPNNY